jgi:predicted TIM-barrel fold metal-dependent hydrolase
MAIIDADAHVEEWAETFSDKYLPAEFAARRPQVVGAGNQAYWLIDSGVIPHPTGRGCMLIGTPTGYGEVPTAFTARKVDADAIDSMEMRRVEARHKAMAAEDIDVQVLYPTLFLAYPISTDPALGGALCRSYNSWLGDVCRQSDRLHFVALVDLDDPHAAAAEVRRARQELGAVGVMILGTAGDRLLDHPSIEPFWAECSAQNLPVSVHVGWSCPSLNQLYDQIMPSFVVPFLVPVFMGFVSVLSSGILERYPNLKVGFFECGSMWLHFLSDRVDHRWHYINDLSQRMPVPAPGAKRRPSQVLRSGQVYISCEVEDALLPQAIELIGAEHILFGSDMPHGDREPYAARELLARQDISDAAKRKILEDNPRRFYNL